MNDFDLAIAALERRLTDAERKVSELRGAINVLCSEAGLAPRYPESAPTGSASPNLSIQSDTFYGKKLGTAAREFLEMKRAQGQGPAKPREIFDGLKQGGFKFGASDETTAIVILRALLRKASNIFHKLPGGEYGLRVWYPHAKPSDDDDGAAASPKGKSKRGKKRRKAKTKASKPAKVSAAENVVDLKPAAVGKAPDPSKAA